MAQAAMKRMLSGDTHQPLQGQAKEQWTQEPRVNRWEGQRAPHGSNPTSTLEKVLTHLRVLMPTTRKSGTSSKVCVKAFELGG